MSRIESLAVLPLANFSGDAAEEYFSDGMTAELIAALARIGSLRLISRTSAMRFKGTRKTLSAIARELGVDAVVEGVVGRSGGKVRITAQLIFAPEDRHIWSETFECGIGDIPALQAEIAQSIALRIDRALQPRNGSTGARPIHPEAYEACLKANYFRDKMTPADLESSIQYFRRATDLDPGYAEAYAGLSQSYFFQGVFGVVHPGESFPKAKAAALKALDLDDTVTAAHNALAAVHILFDCDWAKAEAECRTAIQLSPGDPVGHVHLADYMSIQGRHEEAIATFRHALAMDPISRVYLGHFGLVLYRARQYDQAIEQCRKALEVDPNYANAMWFMSLSLEKKGQAADAVLLLERAVASGGGLHCKALLSRAYALSGDRDRALAILAELQALARTGYVSPFDLAVADLGLGNLSSGLKDLEEAYARRVFRLIELTWPMFDDIRSDPQCLDFVRRIGLL